ncbi:DUF3467 domain-containing protein [bacterium]|nr:DUF3467 domain-containing protein [candidate division CSSED10-310 bacterium]
MSDRKQQQPQQRRQFKMKIDAKEEGGTYSNVATVLSSENEFLVDFGMFLPGSDEIRVGSRIILSPRTAKQLMLALTNNVRNYEAKFGEIRLSPPGATFMSEPDLVQ